MQHLLFLSNATLLYCQKSTKCGVAIIILSFLYGCHISLAEQWRIDGKGPEGGGGAGSPLIFRPN